MELLRNANVNFGKGAGFTETDLKMPKGLNNEIAIKEIATDTNAIYRVGGNDFKFSFWDEVAKGYFQTKMQVSTWDRSASSQFEATQYVEPVFFSKYKDLTSGTTYVWRSTTNDHSKWGITVVNGNKWACFGDLNRVVRDGKFGGNMMRGGGAVTASSI